MGRVEHTIEIEAPTALVWDVLSDLEGVTRWNPNVVDATCGSMPYGVGSTRSCELRPAGSIAETVARWDDGRRIEYAIGSHGGIRSAEMGFELSPGSGVTSVVAFSDYHLAFGPLGPVIDRLTVRRQMQRMLAASLDGLKRFIEARPPVEPPRRRLAPKTNVTTPSEGDSHAH